MGQHKASIGGLGTVRPVRLRTVRYHANVYSEFNTCSARVSSCWLRGLAFPTVQISRQFKASLWSLKCCRQPSSSSKSQDVGEQCHFCTISTAELYKRNPACEQARGTHPSQETCYTWVAIPYDILTASAKVKIAGGSLLACSIWAASSVSTMA